MSDYDKNDIHVLITWAILIFAGGLVVGTTIAGAFYMMTGGC